MGAERLGLPVSLTGPSLIATNPPEPFFDNFPSELDAIY